MLKCAKPCTQKSGWGDRFSSLSGSYRGGGGPEAAIPSTFLPLICPEGQAHWERKDFPPSDAEKQALKAYGDEELVRRGGGAAAAALGGFLAAGRGGAAVAAGAAAVAMVAGVQHGIVPQAGFVMARAVLQQQQQQR